MKRVVIDGGGLVTLDGMGKRRILYQDTCDPRQVWTTSHCDNQAFPRLVVQNLTLAHGNSTGKRFEGGGGGAVFDRGGQLKIVNTTFVGNRCDRTGPDLGGAAVRALSQFRGRPVYVVGSTFRGGRCSNGSGLSSIGVSWTVLNSVFAGNRAIGHGANPQRPGTKGGGSGGAIYTDGDRYRLRGRGHPDAPQPRQRGRRRDLLRQQRPHRHPPPPLVDPAATTSATGFETRPGHLLPRPRPDRRPALDHPLTLAVVPDVLVVKSTEITTRTSGTTRKPLVSE